MTEKFSKDDIERQVFDLYYEVAEKIILAPEVVCFDEDKQEVTVMCDPPAVLRIERGDLRDTVLRWESDTFCQPNYHVAVLEPHRGFDFVRPSHVLGTSFSTKFGMAREARFEVAGPDLQEKYKNARGLDNDEIGGCGAPQPPTP